MHFAGAHACIPSTFDRKMKIPPEILQKLRSAEDEAHKILEDAWKEVSEFDCERIGIRISSNSPLPLMSTEEQAQSLAFIVRYEHLPELNSFVAGRNPRTGLYYLNEIDEIRAALNEYRTIFFNQKDGIYFGAITNLYQKSFCPEEPNKVPMVIQALTKEEEDLSHDYLKHLLSRKKAIRTAVKGSDFDFIYNGVLQHAAKEHSLQMVKQYTDGSLAYMLLKNLILAQGMKELLSEHYKVIRMLNFPRMGSL
jgi:hypothetical protein